MTTGPPASEHANVLLRRLHSAVRRCRLALDNASELHERRLLLERPWEEQFLHWAPDGDAWQLHGHLVPPRRGRHSVTRGGWCPGLAAARPPSGRDAQRRGRGSAG